MFMTQESFRQSAALCFRLLFSVFFLDQLTYRGCNCAMENFYCRYWAQLLTQNFQKSETTQILKLSQRLTLYRKNHASPLSIDNYKNSTEKKGRKKKMASQIPSFFFFLRSLLFLFLQKLRLKMLTNRKQNNLKAQKNFNDVRLHYDLNPHFFY